METTTGTLSPPLGRGRLAVINLIVAMCQFNDQKLKEEVCRLNFIPLFMASVIAWMVVVADWQDCSIWLTTEGQV
ncbi:unnamed protein product [Dibothriocephalus latus]|uniref:Uncharacterized protein n=1 Tax=Dibothriocephalus latus TaxID=60516 RepID=A0A3P7LB59_DIBLA|nr:unnamed protein product [Dibothriocephalus latus]